MKYQESSQSQKPMHLRSGLPRRQLRLYRKEWKKAFKAGLLKPREKMLRVDGTRKFQISEEEH